MSILEEQRNNTVLLFLLSVIEMKEIEQSVYGGRHEKRKNIEKNIENNIGRIADNSFACIDKFHTCIITKNIWYECVGGAMGQCIL
jgi:hypothetical protein